MKATLYYVHDPMCSWCWGFRKVWREARSGLPDAVSVRCLAGGLAPDSDVPMPEAMREKLQGIWHGVRANTGAEFNFDFWTQNIPRRSTYPSCRAVLAAKRQGAETEMIEAVQRAYYLEAKNPSDVGVLKECAERLKLDRESFARDLASEAVEREFRDQRALSARLGVRGFPSLRLETERRIFAIETDYRSSVPILRAVEAALRSET